MKRVALVVALLALSSVPLFGEENVLSSIGTPAGPVTSPGRGVNRDAFGAAVGAYTIHGLDIHPISNNMGWGYAGFLSRYRTAGPDLWMHAPITLPSGVKITGLELDACDGDATGGLATWIMECGPSSSDCVSYNGPFTGGAATPGCTFFVTAFDPPITIDQWLNSYTIEINFGSTSTTLNVRAVRILYERQVSPGPAVATFADVPTSHGFFKFVEALAAAGITGGCGGGNYCPNSPVTRGQMAVFLATALGLHWAP